MLRSLGNHKGRRLAPLHTSIKQPRAFTDARVPFRAMGQASRRRLKAYHLNSERAAPAQRYVHLPVAGRPSPTSWLDCRGTPASCFEVCAAHVEATMPALAASTAVTITM